MIINFGSINIDYVYRVKNFVQPGETITSQNLSRHIGGKGANQSVACARAGAKVRHIGAVGSDGKFILDELQNNGIDVSCVYLSEQSTGHAVIQVNDQGENSIILHPGANFDLPEKIIDEALASADQNDFILLQNELSASAQIMKKAAAKKLKIAFNAAPMNNTVKTFPLELLHTLFINETEGETLTDLKKPEDIIKKLIDRFPLLNIILTLGADGALYAKGAERIKVLAEKVKAVDTTAAGDTFTGYYLAALQKGLNVEKALQLAVSAAGICVTGFGAIPSIPWYKEVEAVSAAK
ncbi:MAG: hypothetical protein A2096_14980 [Spirochaetes bacterium GWF1_41_5]|nr:MAG: hypothetical protein A2096_14980 [Spirochaetes bacterium GWF1_41_5]